MRNFTFGAAGLVALSLSLTACNGGEICDDTDCAETGDVGETGCENCPDGGGDDTGHTGSDNLAQVTGYVYVGDAEEACLINFGDGSSPFVVEQTVSSGTIAELEEGDYNVLAGDLDLASDASDGYPLHVDPDGLYWIAPKQRIEVVNGDVESLEFDMNLFIKGEWSCAEIGNEDTDDIDEETVTYENGEELNLPIGDWIVNGMKLSFETDTGSASGEFLSDTYMIGFVPHSQGDRDIECWKGDKYARPEPVSE